MEEAHLIDQSLFSTISQWLFPFEASSDCTPEELGHDWSTILSFIVLIKCRAAIGKMLLEDDDL